MPNETIIAYPDSIANKGMSLHSGSIPNHCSRLDFYEGPDEAISTYLATVKINKMPDYRTCPDGNFTTPDIILKMIQQLIVLDL
jgi:hypothetical protein